MKWHCKHTSTAGEKQPDSDRSRAGLLPHGSCHRCHGLWLGLLFWSPSLVCVSSLHPRNVEVRAAVEFAGTDWQILMKHACSVTQRSPEMFKVTDVSGERVCSHIKRVFPTLPVKCFGYHPNLIADFGVKSGVSFYWNLQSVQSWTTAFSYRVGH